MWLLGILAPSTFIFGSTATTVFNLLYFDLLFSFVYSCYLDFVDAGIIVLDTAREF